MYAIRSYYAVHSLRAQADRIKFHTYMKQVVEGQENLDVKQAEIVEIESHNGVVTGVVTRIKARYKTKAVIIATGTYLNGLIHVGHTAYSSGPDSCLPATFLSDSLKELGLTIRRFKTRITSYNVCYTKLLRWKNSSCVESFPAINWTSSTRRKSAFLYFS